MRVSARKTASVVLIGSGNTRNIIQNHSHVSKQVRPLKRHFFSQILEHEGTSHIYACFLELLLTKVRYAEWRSSANAPKDAQIETHESNGDFVNNDVGKGASPSPSVQVQVPSFLMQVLILSISNFKTRRKGRSVCWRTARDIHNREYEYCISERLAVFTKLTTLFPAHHTRHQTAEIENETLTSPH